MSVFFFLLEMPKVNFNKGVCGVRKWQFARLDDLDLLCEVNIFLTCSWPGGCRVCRKYLTWCLEILMDRWNYIRYIDFYYAPDVVKNNRKLFNQSFNFESAQRKKQRMDELLCRKNYFFNNLTFT